MTTDRPVAAESLREKQAATNRKPFENAVVAAVIVLLLAPSAVWIARDHSVWPWDQAWYGQVATDLWFAATHSLRAWQITMLHAIDMKPPAITWIGQFFVPLRGVLGSVENALLFSILVTQGALLWTIFKIGEAVSRSRFVAFTGVVFAAGAQAFVGLSHQMFVEPLQALCVAWVVYIAVMCREWPVARSIVHLASALLLGVAAKTTTPVYCLLFLIYIGGILLSRRSRPNFHAEWRHWPSRILICLFAPAAIATSAWYLFTFRAAWRHARDSSYGDLALHYGFRAALGQKLVIWTRLFDQSLLYPFLGWGFLAAALLAAMFVLRSSQRRPAPAAILLWLSAAQSALLLLIFASNITVDARYMYALVVFVVLLFTGLCGSVPSRWAIAALLLICTMQWGATNAVALGARGMFANQFGRLVTPQPDPSQYDELTRAVQRTSLSNEWTNVIGVEEPWFNANSAEFFAAEQSLVTGVRSHYIALGYAQNSVDRAMHRIFSYRAHYIATLDEPHQEPRPNYLNLVALPVLRDMKSDSRFQQIPFSSNKGILLFERR
ncbi:MAG TPA: hypothetical protein VMH80_26710 [Bryobacteraceae bacterium]|nr:hypothetical protein [Bryobacteraceae bacterium]